MAAKTNKSKKTKKKAPSKKSVKAKKKAPAQKATKAKKKKAPAKKTAKAVKKKVKKTVKKKSVKKKVTKKAAKKTTKKSIKKTPAKTASKKSAKPAKDKPQKKSRARLEPSVSKIRDQLIQERNELMSMIRSSQEVERNVGDITFSNEIDLASSLEGREMAFQLSSRERNELKMIEDALFKISEGTYGVCDGCSKKIGAKRLQIMPLTPLCIECQSNLEVT